MKIKKIILFLAVLIMVSGCNALQGTKRSDTSDEFLVEKKNPLVVPPDFDELPVPVGQDVTVIEQNKSNEIKKLLQSKQSTENNQQSGSNNLEESILKKINK